MNHLTNSKPVSPTYSSEHNNGIHKEISEWKAGGSNCSTTDSITNTSSTSSIDTTTTTDSDRDSNSSTTALAAIAESYAEAGTASWGLRLWKEVR